MILRVPVGYTSLTKNGLTKFILVGEAVTTTDMKAINRSAEAVASLLHKKTATVFFEALAREMAILTKHGANLDEVHASLMKEHEVTNKGDDTDE